MTYTIFRLESSWYGSVFKRESYQDEGIDRSVYERERGQGKELYYQPPIVRRVCRENGVPNVLCKL